MIVFGGKLVKFNNHIVPDDSILWQIGQILQSYSAR